MLDGRSQTAIYVPAGMALGYQTMADETMICYQMPEFYDPQFERGVRWNDPAFSIAWPDAQPTIECSRRQLSRLSMLTRTEFDDARQPMYDLVRRLFPLCRSITGDGVRETLRIVGEHIPLTMHEVPSGTKAFDWTVPREWNIRDAYIKNGQGERVVDFRINNLHVVSYSVPVRKTMRLAELQPHLHSLPDQPDLIPYRTSYYEESWGFCLSHRQRESLPDGDYEVVIDSTLSDGSLSYGECLLPGAQRRRGADLHAHLPSVAGQRQPGGHRRLHVSRAAAGIGEAPLHLPVRVRSRDDWVAGLAQSQCQDRATRVRHGLVAVLLGDSGGLRYKRSRARRRRESTARSSTR